MAHSSKKINIKQVVNKQVGSASGHTCQRHKVNGCSAPPLLFQLCALTLIAVCKNNAEFSPRSQQSSTVTN